MPLKNFVHFFCQINSETPIDLNTILNYSKTQDFDINEIKLEYGNVSLAHALAYRCDTETLSHCVKNMGLNINVVDIMGETPAHHCLKNYSTSPDKKIEFLKVYIQLGGIISSKNKMKRNLMHLAAFYGGKISYVIPFLKSQKISFEDRDVNDLTPPKIALEEKNFVAFGYFTHDYINENEGKLLTQPSLSSPQIPKRVNNSNQVIDLEDDTVRKPNLKVKIPRTGFKIPIEKRPSPSPPASDDYLPSDSDHDETKLVRKRKVILSPPTFTIPKNPASPESSIDLNTDDNNIVSKRKIVSDSDQTTEVDTRFSSKTKQKYFDPITIKPNYKPNFKTEDHKKLWEYMKKNSKIFNHVHNFKIVDFGAIEKRKIYKYSDCIIPIGYHAYKLWESTKNNEKVWWELGTSERDSKLYFWARELSSNQEVISYHENTNLQIMFNEITQKNGSIVQGYPPLMLYRLQQNGVFQKQFQDFIKSK